jgi:hypothetical protein
MDLARTRATTATPQIYSSISSEEFKEGKTDEEQFGQLFELLEGDKNDYC